MLRHRLMQAYYALRAIKRLDLAKAVRIVKNGKSPKSLRAADLRLELVYGWGPFLSDIYGLCGMKPPPLDQKIKEFFGEPQNFSEEVTNNYPRQNAVGTKTFKGKTSAVVMLEIEVDTPLIVSAGQLGLTNPLNTAWELVPFSFVVDWFIPIQQYIEQYDALDGIYVKDQLLITKARYTSTFDTMFHGSSMYSYRRMERTKVFSLNPPPHFKNPVSIDHVLNALALIRSVKGGTRGWRFG
nr:MAG: maturation protein [Sanya fiers-like virus 14]